MKRFIISICLIIVIMATGLVSLWHAGYSCRVLSEQIEYMQTEAVMQSDELRVRETEKLVEMWTVRKDWLLHHSHHGSMSKIGSALSRAAVYAEEGETLHLRAELAELYWLFHGILEDEALTLDNIF